LPPSGLFGRAALRRGQLQHRGIGARVERKAVLGVMQGQRAASGIAAQGDVAAIEHFAIGLPQHRHQQLVGQRRVRWLPVDVEMTSELRCRPVLKHVHPPGVVGAEHAHVVGHLVQQQAHAQRARSPGEAEEALHAAQLGIDLRVVDDVVAV